MSFKTHFALSSLKLNKLGSSLCGSHSRLSPPCTRFPHSPACSVPGHSLPFLWCSPLSFPLISESFHILSARFPFHAYQHLYFFPICVYSYFPSLPKPSYFLLFSIAVTQLAVLSSVYGFSPLPSENSLIYFLFLWQAESFGGYNVPRILGWVLQGWNWALSCWKTLANASNHFNVNERLQRSWICFREFLCSCFPCCGLVGYPPN